MLSLHSSFDEKTISWLSSKFGGVERVVHALPTAFVCASAVAIAWHHDGSVLASDWLPYAALVTLVLAAVLFSSSATLSRLPLACAALVGGFGLWTAISARWSPVPSLARDEFFLIALYGFVLVLQGRGFRSETGRIASLAVIVAALGASAVAVAAVVRFGADPAALYGGGGRLVAPISYVNAAAAFFLVGLWPALVLAARRGQHPLLRGVALAAAAAMLAGWLGTQSKGGAVALAVSAIAVFAVVPGRLRLLVPTVLVSGLVFSQYYPLTGPFRAQGDEVARRAGTVALLIAAAGLVVGVAYALADNRLRVPPRVRKAAAIAVTAAGAVALAVGGLQADRRIEDRSAFVRDQWESFKQTPTTESGSSHLVNLGSNRYDFWRVSLTGFEEHPVGGIGGRGFGPWYLQHGSSYETPARAHSLPLDALLETGVVGFVLLLAAFTAILFGLLRRLHTVAGAAAFGALAYFAVHATGDWVWTFPAVGLPVFALIGIALAPEDGWALIGRRAGVAAAAVALFALAVFVPPWLSARITDGALAGTTSPDSLRWATVLDPLTVEPYLVEAALATRPEDAIPPLEQAAEREPRSAAVRLYLGRAYLEAGRFADAEAQLLEAQQLFPGDEEIADALARARR